MAATDDIPTLCAAPQIGVAQIIRHGKYKVPIGACLFRVGGDDGPVHITPS
ncbi:hypothetical protein [Limnohabitans sp. Rim8]|uniref:hypothetical protein n=1 Tax=Limnohabitans sp. Rim8 TaxID=1100718 RepID=UPI00263778DD|nr:hypothetical protein [Limnohabitans sp. Rim8]